MKETIQRDDPITTHGAEQTSLKDFVEFMPSFGVGSRWSLSAVSEFLMSTVPANFPRDLQSKDNGCRYLLRALTKFSLNFRELFSVQRSFIGFNLARQDRVSSVSIVTCSAAELVPPSISLTHRADGIRD